MSKQIRAVNVIGRRGFSNRHNRKNNSFFVRPYIKLGELDGVHIKQITLAPLWQNPPQFELKQFEGKVWEVNVQNKLKKFWKFRISRTAINCHVAVHLFDNDNRDTGIEYPLNWSKSENLPNELKYGEPINTKEGYNIALPFSYIGELLSFSFSLTSITLPDGAENKFLFAFTFSESNSLFIITQYDNVLRKDEVVQIPFDELDNYTFSVLVNREGHDDKEGKRFKIHANSWDDMTLTWV